MHPATFLCRFPRGQLPAQGHRCPRCGEEVLSIHESARLQRQAQRLGLYGITKSRRRKLQRTGNSVTVSLDPELLRGALKGAGPGTVVEVGQVGDHIEVRLAGAED